MPWNRYARTSFTLLPSFSDRARIDHQTKIRVFKADDSNLRVPENFDGRIAWREYLSPVGDQQKCGACWIFAAAAMLSDRMAIHTKGKLKVHLSPTKALLCDFGEEISSKETPDMTPDQIRNLNTIALKDSDAMGCHGNTLPQALLYLYRWGIPDYECAPFEMIDKVVSREIPDGEPQPLPKCQDVFGQYVTYCAHSKKPMRLYRFSDVYEVPDSEYAIMVEIYRNGPIISGHSLYENFMEWDGRGIFADPPKGSLITGHAVEVVGWGTDPKTNVKYWIIRNSWGPDWGENGFFKLKRGINNGEIEQNAFAGYPDFDNLMEDPPERPRMSSSQISRQSDFVIRDIDQKFRREFPLVYGFPQPLVENGEIDPHPLIRASDVIQFDAFKSGLGGSDGMDKNEINWWGIGAFAAGAYFIFAKKS